MKKIMPTKLAMIAVALAVLALSPVFAQVSAAGQTFYYQYVQTVDPQTEVRSLSRGMARAGVTSRAMAPEGLYITFTRNGCYPSDEKGIYKYYDSGINTNLYDQDKSYECVQGETTSASYTFKSVFGSFLTFSADYKRLNFNSTDSYYHLPNVYVYEQYAPPAPQQQTGPAGPDRMW